jgi:hypothetical protein
LGLENINRPLPGDAMLGAIVWMATETTSFAFMPFYAMKNARLLAFNRMLNWTDEMAANASV